MISGFKIIYMFMQRLPTFNYNKYQWTPIFWEQAYHMMDQQLY